MQVIPIQRVHQHNLSLQRFVEEFAIPRMPVIITGLNMSSEPWTLEHIKKKVRWLGYICDDPLPFTLPSPTLSYLTFFKSVEITPP